MYSSIYLGDGWREAEVAERFGITGQDCVSSDPPVMIPCDVKSYGTFCHNKNHTKNVFGGLLAK